MTTNEWTMLLATTMSCCLCIGFMIFCTITWARLESKMDRMREERKAMRSEMDALRQRLKKKEKENAEV